MRTIGKLKYVLLTAVVILILMIIKNSDNKAWKGKTTQAASLVSSGSCYIRLSELKESDEQTTILRFGDTNPDSLHFSQIVLTFNDLADKKTVRELTSRNNRYIIVSGSPADGMKAWVMLNQLGVENLFILSGGKGTGEELKYRFRPDTSFRPEPLSPEN